jgi:H+-translocating NAD(P) transhydrogenase subunit alpha
VHLAVPAETQPGERRVALVPDVVKRLVSGGWEVVVQSGAGSAADFTDDSYAAAGASVAPDATATHRDAAVVVRVRPPTADEARLVPEGAAHLSFLQPHDSLEALKVFAERRVSVFSFDLVPRISRAQGMDALSSQSTVSGYRAALEAAEHLKKFFPMFMTAAGTVPPAKVLVMGAGVAGLQAIATARRLGAVVRAYDVRAAAKEEAASLGASFVDLGVSAEGAGGYARELTDDELRRQQEALSGEVAASDVVITTAAVPGKRAPVLVTADMVDRMATGAVVIDMAADSGGNCELSVPGDTVVKSGTAVVGMTNPPAGLPTHASFLYARNVANILGLLGKDGAFVPDWEDEVVLGTCVLRSGEPAHDSVAALLGAPVAGQASPAGDPL